MTVSKPWCWKIIFNQRIHNPGIKSQKSNEVLANLSNFVTPAKAGVQTSSRRKSGTSTIFLDSGFRRNDVTGLLQEALLRNEFSPDLTKGE